MTRCSNYGTASEISGPQSTKSWFPIRANDGLPLDSYPSDRKQHARTFVMATGVFLFVTLVFAATGTNPRQMIVHNAVDTGMGSTIYSVVFIADSEHTTVNVFKGIKGDLASYSRLGGAAFASIEGLTQAELTKVTEDILSFANSHVATGVDTFLIAGTQRVKDSLKSNVESAKVEFMFKGNKFTWDAMKVVDDTTEAIFYWAQGNIDSYLTKQFKSVLVLSPTLLASVNFKSAGPAISKNAIVPQVLKVANNEYAVYTALLPPVTLSISSTSGLDTISTKVVDGATASPCMPKNINAAVGNSGQGSGDSKICQKMLKKYVPSKIGSKYPVLLMNEAGVFHQQVAVGTPSAMAEEACTVTEGKQAQSQLSCLGMSIVSALVNDDARVSAGVSCEGNLLRQIPRCSNYVPKDYSLGMLAFYSA